MLIVIESTAWEPLNRQVMIVTESTTWEPFNRQVLIVTESTVQVRRFYAIIPNCPPLFDVLPYTYGGTLCSMPQASLWPPINCRDDEAAECRHSNGSTSCPTIFQLARLSTRSSNMVSYCAYVLVLHWTNTTRRMILKDDDLTFTLTWMTSTMRGRKNDWFCRCCVQFSWWRRRREHMLRRMNVKWNDGWKMRRLVMDDMYGVCKTLCYLWNCSQEIYLWSRHRPTTVILLMWLIGWVRSFIQQTNKQTSKQANNNKLCF